MKILLVQCYLKGSYQPIFPLGLAYLAGNLPSHDVMGLDLNLHEEPLSALKNALKDFKPDVVGISLRNIDNVILRDLISFYEDFKLIVRNTKEIASNAIVVVGGAGFSMFANDIMKQNRGIDFGVFQEGEESFPELLDNINNPQNIKGIFYRSRKKIKFTGVRTLKDVNHLPLPRRDIFEVPKYCGPFKHTQHSSYKFGIGIQSKRGCPLNCTYCNYPFLSGSKRRLRNPTKVVDEIQEVYNIYKVDCFYFADTVFNAPLEHAEEICREIIKRKLKIKWAAYFDIRFLNEEFLVLAKRAGCESFEFSPDGVSKGALKGLNKGISKADIVNTIKIFKNNKELKKSEVIFYFFVNPPGETFWGLLQTIFFVKRISMALKGRGGACLNWIKILPGTALYKVALKEGAITKDKNLLHKNKKELKELFYSKRPLKNLDFLTKHLIRILKIG